MKASVDNFYFQFRLCSCLSLAPFISLCILVSSCKKEKTTFVFAELNSGISHDLNDIYFVNDTTGYTCGGDRYIEGNILKTTDGGATWMPQGENLEKALNRINFISSDTGFIVGIDGKMYKTLDGGNTYILYQSGRYQPLHDVWMLNAHKGFCCGGDGYKTGYIYTTNDGGDSWSIDTFPQEFRSLFFTDEETGFVAGYGAIFKTIDGGVNWQFTTASGDFFQSVYFTNGQTGYVVGSEGTILKTTDGGTNWKHLRNGNNLLQETWHLEQIVFRNSTEGYIIGEKGLFLKTTNAGESWEEVENAPLINLHGISLTEDGGYLCGEGGKIYRFLE
ncbi:MAG: YCF48-related protein [Chitinophagales bacterium]